MNEEEKSILDVYGVKSKKSDELVANTLEEVGFASRGEGADILYEILTNSGDKRYIHEYLNMMPTRPNLNWMGNMTRANIENNPATADTISYKEGKGRLAPQKNIITRLLETMGY